jgi:hypothetical protein
MFLLYFICFTSSCSNCKLHSFFLCEFIFMMFSMYVQRVLEQRVTALLDKLLVKPSLVNLPPMEEGGLLLVCRIAWSTVSSCCVSV